MKETLHICSSGLLKESTARNIKSHVDLIKKLNQKYEVKFYGYFSYLPETDPNNLKKHLKSIFKTDRIELENIDWNLNFKSVGTGTPKNVFSMFYNMMKNVGQIDLSNFNTNDICIKIRPDWEIDLNSKYFNLEFEIKPNTIYTPKLLHSGVIANDTTFVSRLPSFIPAMLGFQILPFMIPMMHPETCIGKYWNSLNFDQVIIDEHPWVGVPW